MIDRGSAFPGLSVELLVGEDVLGTGLLIPHHLGADGKPMLVGTLIPTSALWQHATLRDGRAVFARVESLTIRTAPNLQLLYEDVEIRERGDDQSLLMHLRLSPPSGDDNGIHAFDGEACGYCGLLVREADGDRVFISVAATAGEAFEYAAHRRCLENSLGEQLRGTLRSGGA